MYVQVVQSPKSPDQSFHIPILKVVGTMDRESCLVGGYVYVSPRGPSTSLVFVHSIVNRSWGRSLGTVPGCFFVNLWLLNRQLYF